MLIGVVGFISCGKGTVGDLLEQRGFVKDSFVLVLSCLSTSIGNYNN